ncbi:MAG: hypothetical protein JRI98_06210 [Deltaproteobacteria bacterium]|nr:hypothetical protein [Deltaproteobacteria bacterium]
MLQVGFARRLLTFSFLLSFPAFLFGSSGCGSSGSDGGGGGVGGAGGGGGVSALEESLNVLGVDTTATVRVDPDQDNLPDDYSPLGSSASFGSPDEFSDESGANKTDEIFIVNAAVSGGASRMNVVEQVGVQINGDGSVNPGTTSVLHTLPDAGNEWIDETQGGDSDNQQALRDVAAGDVDDDGLEEIVIVFVDTSAADRVLKIKVIEDMEDGYAEIEETIADGDAVLDVSIATGDFNGDGVDQVAVVLTKEGTSELLIVSPQSGGNGERASGFTVDEALSKTFEHTVESAIDTVEIASGNLDYDNANELVVVVNELVTNPLGGVATYYVYDDQKTSLDLLQTGPVTGTDGQAYVARQADVTTGDIDGDGLDEVVFAGLTDFGTSCDDDYNAILTALDDAKHGLEPLSAKFFEPFFSKCPAFGPWRLRFIHVNALDLDGDGFDEVHANQFVFEDLVDTGAFGEPIHEMPEDIFVDGDTDAGAYITSASTTIATGDVTGDGRENILVYTPWQTDVRIFGLSNIETVGFAELSRIEANSGANTQTKIGPLLVPVNVDMDSPVLKYSDGEYQLVFTEPVLIALLAAAPCGDGIGQNIDACSVSFGQTESSTIDASITVSVKAGIHAGVKTGANVPFVGDVGAEFKQSITLSASISAGAAYTVEKSRVFVPYDRYTYRILSHPDPELIGGEVVVSLPREPIMLKVERGFYNTNIVDTSVPVDDNMFSHTVGDLQSYPSVSEKNMLLSQYGGLENGPISVGQGGGSDGLGIDVSTEISLGASLGIEIEKSVDVTAGPAMAGYSVGYGVSASLTVTSGASTSYSVTVGDLSAETFADSQYSYGMFTYVQTVSDEEFEVINFWVE